MKSFEFLLEGGRLLGRREGPGTSSLSQTLEKQSLNDLFIYLNKYLEPPCGKTEPQNFIG